MKDKYLPGVLIGVVIVIIITVITIISDPYSEGYKQGQIDALTGTVHYELVTSPDSTRSWERKKSNEVY